MLKLVSADGCSTGGGCIVCVWAGGGGGGAVSVDGAGMVGGAAGVMVDVGG